MSIHLFPVSLSLFLSHLFLSLPVCFVEMMDGPISPPAVNEAKRVCDVDLMAKHFSKTFQDLQINITL